MDKEAPLLLIPRNGKSAHTVSEVAKEIKHLYKIAFPMIITGLLIYGKSAISVLFMGMLGKEALAGGSLSTGIANITGISIISGLATGIEAISSQSCGAKQWHLMGLALQRMIVILLIVSAPISLLWLNMNPILIYTGQDPAISAIASSYLAYLVPDLFFQSVINPLKIYLRTQNITLPLMIGAGFALAIHAPINYVLVFYLQWGIQGIAISATITDLNFLLFVLGYIWVSGCCSCSWKGWSLDCFKEWRPVLKLAIPSCVSVCLEWWWYEVMIVLSGLLTEAAEAVAAMGILLQATALVYIFPSALGLAVSTRVGNELGANQPGKARNASVVGLWCAVGISLAAMVFMYTMRETWGRAFTDDGETLSLAAAVMPVAALCELGNCPQTTGCGVLRGSARPSAAANINLGAFYGVGLPVAVLMGLFVRMGLVGLWLGLFAAQVVCAVVMAVVVLTTEWAEEGNRGRELIGIIDEDDEDEHESEEAPKKMLI